MSGYEKRDTQRLMNLHIDISLARNYIAKYIYGVNL